MNRRQTILQYRTSGKLKGHRAVIVNLKRNIGRVYNGNDATYIFTIGKDNVYFQRLSFFTKKLVPEKDFSLSISRIKSYNLREQNMVTNCLTLYTIEKCFIEIFYNTKTVDTYEGEQNILSIIKKLEEFGIKELDE